MKAVQRVFSWRPLCGAAVVGALAIAVSVQGSPRVGDGERGGAKGKSEASSVVRGPSANINSAVSAGPGPYIRFHAVNPTTSPASSYPGGSSIGGVNNSRLTLGAVPARAWFFLEIGGWSPTSMRTSQVRIDATGFMGSNAVCAGLPANGGNIVPAQHACPSANAAGNTFCSNAFAGVSSCPGQGAPVKCTAQFGPLICEPGFQVFCNASPEWAYKDVSGTVAAVDISSLAGFYRYGATCDPDAEANDNNPSYLGTMVLDVPANAKGLYTFGFDLTQSYFLQPLGEDIPIVSTTPGQIEIPCGSCCTDLGPGTSVCTDGVTDSECQALPTTNVRIFRANTSCASQECPSCTSNAQCADGDACTQDICSNFVCSNPPIVTWNQATQCCNSANGQITTLGCPPGTKCGEAACSLPGNHGVAQCNPTPGASCNDDNPCTYADTCGEGLNMCAGTDANSVACTDSSDCAAATGVGYPCIDGHCNCTLTPDLDIDILDDPGGNCFQDGEKVLAAAHVAASSSPVNGGQILIAYDPTCLDYVDTIYVEPYTNVLYGPIVNEETGRVFVAVGVQFGAGNGPNGNADLVQFSFIKKGHCNSCQICPMSQNPQNTYLTDDKGQRISVQMNCSKTIYDADEVTLTVPDNIKTNVDCDRPTAVEHWAAPSATSACGNVQVFCRGEHESGLVYNSATVNTGGTFPIGASSFCCYAVSDGPCGTTVGCPPDTSCADADGNGKPDGCWTVTVNDETSLDITVGLSPTSQSKPGANLTRCIKFTLYSNCVQEPLVFSDDVTFGGLFNFVGKSTGKIKIPGSGQWDCITAQDQMHTLRSCYTFPIGNPCVNGQLTAYFSGDPRLGGNWLIGGNLDGWKKNDPNANPSLDVIDILDFGTFVSQYLRNYGFTNTPCGTPGPNADINGDGVADLTDYAFIAANFLTSSKQCCCGPQTASVNAITEISVADLRAMGQGELAIADLNGDGLLNLADMAAFEQGVRPTKSVPAKGGTRSTGSR